MCCQFSYTLELRAAVAYAKYLLRKREIITKISDSWLSVECRLDIRKGIYSVVKKEIKKENLPELFEIYVAHVAYSMALKIFDWANYLKVEFDINISCKEKIYWNDNGTINQTKMFHFMTSDDQLKTQVQSLISMACQCAQVWYIESQFSNFNQFEHLLGCDSSKCIFACKSFDINKNSKNVESNQKYKSELVRIFNEAVEKGSDVAVKYYWGKLTKEEQEDNIIPCMTRCLELCWFWCHRGFRENFKKEKCVLILIFLITKMTDGQRKKLFANKGCDILYMFLLVWPAQEFFIELFDNCKDYLSISQYTTILEEMVLHFDQQYDSKKAEFHYKLFKIVWFSFMKKNEKKSTQSEPGDCLDLSKILIPLYRTFHLEALNLVINDKHLENQRDQLINLGRKKFNALVNEGCYLWLNKFVEEILVTDEEKKKFKLSFSGFYDKFIRRREFDSVENLFKWQLDSEEKKQEFMKKWNYIKSKWKQLMEEGEFDEAEKILKYSSFLSIIK